MELVFTRLVTSKFDVFTRMTLIPTETFAAHCAHHLYVRKQLCDVSNSVCSSPLLSLQRHGLGRGALEREINVFEFLNVH